MEGKGCWVDGERTQQWLPFLYLHWYQPAQASVVAKKARKVTAAEMMRTILKRIGLLVWGW